jgi:hypothetical protein
MSLGGHSSVLAAIIGALDALSIRYFVGGSFPASCLANYEPHKTSIS